MIDNGKDSLEEITASALSKNLRTRWLGRKHLVFDAVGSTNEVLKELAQEGEPAGTMVISDYQGEGKGRHGRRWLAPPGSSLLFSILLRPKWAPENIQRLMMLAGVAAVEATGQETGLQLRLKWPNDLVAWEEGTSWRKCGGFLLETDIEGHTVRYAVLGTGINVNVSRDQLGELSPEATSLQVETGMELSRLALLGAYLARLERLYDLVDAGDIPFQKWRSLLVNLGRPVRVELPGGSPALVGTAEDVNHAGQLLVRDSQGKIHAVAGGYTTFLS